MPNQTQGRYWAIAAVVFFVALWYLGSVMLPFLVGGAVAYFLDPVADRLERLGLSRALATLMHSSIRSNAPTEVPPAHSTTPAGTNPAAWSAAMAAVSASGTIDRLASVAIFTRFSCPIPAIRTALSTEEWV